MSARRTLSRLAAVAGAVLVTFAVAPPAHAAEDVDVRIGGLDSSMIAGGRFDSFTTVLRNRSTKTGYQHVQRVFHIRLGGLTPDGLRLAKGGFNLLAVESAGPGAVRVVDPFSVQLTPEGDRESTATGQYQIQFTSAAPQGRATIIFEAVSAGQSLGSASDSVRVRGLANPEKTKPVPTVAVPPLTPGAQPSLAPLDDEVAGAAGGSGMPVIFYVLGALMVAAGGGILWLLFRERQPTLVGAQYPATEYPPGGLRSPHPPHPPYPTPSVYPTAVLPAIRDPQAPGHDGSHRLDATHELGANPGRPRP